MRSLLKGLGFCTRWEAIIKALSLMVLLAGPVACTQQEQDIPRGSLQLGPCERDHQTGAPPAVGGAECGILQLAEHPASPNSKSIGIHVMRWPAISAVAEGDPLFVIAGGPGQGASDIAPQFVQAFFNIRKNRDIIFVDQRGTGKSN